MTKEPATTAFEVRGFRTLARVGGRVTFGYGLTAAVGLITGAGGAAVPAAVQVVLLTGLAATACTCAGFMLPVGRGRHVTDHAAEVLWWVPASRALRCAAPYLLIGLVILCALLVLVRVSSFGPVLGWPRVHVLAGWILPGAALGLVLATGPLWGVASFALLAVGYEVLASASAGVLPLAVAAVAVAMGCAAHLAARSYFRGIERTARAAEEARISRHEAQTRLVDRRRTDRTLHDTVLATLTVLAHAGVGVPDEEVRTACRRDLALLCEDRPDRPDRPAADGSWPGGAARAGLDAGPDAAPRGLPGVPLARAGGQAAAVPGAARAEVPGQLARRLGEVRRQAAGRGIDLRVHLPSGSTADALTQPGDDPALLQAWSGALSECVANIARHADVDAADVMLGLTDDALVTVVVDEGVGFEPSAVGGERLGLAGSVHERLVEVGGEARVWSRPGQGTVVELLVPWPSRQPVGAVPGGGRGATA